MARDDIVYAPCVYGYATYGEADMRLRLGFAPFPGPRAPHQAGTAIGGTAIALSRHCRHRDAALAFMAHALSDTAQLDVIPAHHGQPALAAAWRSPAIDSAYNGFYAATRTTLATAWVRPRLRGYPLFQQQAGVVAARCLAGDLTRAAAVSAILELAAEVGAR